MSNKNEGPVLVPFGPDREVPKCHRWCNACDGSGNDSLKDDAKCVVCHGKGHWNAKDIDQYHVEYPDVCRRSCGEHHKTPSYLNQ